MKQLARLKAVFPNRAGLFARIDTYVANSAVLKIGIIPHASTRAHIKPVLEALVADPLDDAKWFGQFADRPLTKDVVVTQSEAFEYVETRNSAVEYPLPVQGPAIEYIEASSLATSREHLQACDAHILASTDPAGALRMPTTSEHPRILVLDSPTLLGSLGGGSLGNLGFDESRAVIDAVGSGEIVVDTKSALAADALLRQSPQNISQYLELQTQSHIKPLKALVQDVAKIRAALLESIFATCQRVIDESRPRIDETAPGAGVNGLEISSMRKQWTRSAHRELQAVLLPAVSDLVHRQLAWYKLYAKVDDVESVGAAELSAAFLPESRKQLDYVVGRIDQAAPASVDEPATSPSGAAVNPQVPWREAQVGAHNAVSRLHNQALKAVFTSLVGVQIPLAALSVAGYVFADFSAYSMGALAGLGAAVGLYRLQKMWYAAGQQFSKSIETLALDVIRNSDAMLWDMFESRLTLQQTAISERERVLAEVQRAVQKDQKHLEDDPMEPNEPVSSQVKASKPKASAPVTSAVHV